MRKYLALVVLILATMVAHAQYSTGTGTITDSNGTVWVGATVTATFYPTPNFTGNYTWNGVQQKTFAPVTVTANGSGAFSIQVPDNNLIAPSKSMWTFTFCPLASVTCNTSVPVVMTGGSVALSTLATTTITPPSITPTAIQNAYNDGEVAPLNGLGSLYYRTSDSTLREWNGSAWVAAGGGGSGNVIASPQYRIFIQPNAGTQAVAQGASATQNAVAPLLQGSYNTDLFTSGGGNNGLGNLEAGACSSGGCTPMFPATSTSTETAVPTVTNTHVQDYRNGSQGDFFYNPNPLGAGGYASNGDRPSSARTLFASWDASTINGSSQNQAGETYNLNFNGPGWNWGTNTGATISDWSAQHAQTFNMNVSTQGIGQVMSGTLTKYAVGDSAWLYGYSRPDGGWQDPSGEGSDGIGIQVLQNNTWFIGKAGTGATTGTQSLPTTWTNTTNSRPQYSVGGYMLDTSRPLLANAHVTGPSVEVGSLYAWAFPVDATVTESTAWGTANAAIPQPSSPIGSQSDTVSFTVIGGTNAGGYTTGKAWLDGGQLQEQVMITAVGAISGGVQSVTFTHRYPNSQTGTSLWQGGTNGFYDSSYISNSFNNWTTAYTIIGATDSSHLVGRFSAGGSNSPIPSFYNSNTANVPATNLSISGTTVTAQVSGSAGYLLNHLNSIVISGATNSSFNGTGTNVILLNNSTLQWTQTGPSGTSASANISYPPLQFAFYLFPGAQVTQPTLTTTVPLEPNDVPWTPNDIIYNVFYPAYRGALITSNNAIYNPDAGSIAAGTVGAFGATLSGAGISGTYQYLGYNNANSPTIYRGDGGVLSPPTGIAIKGPIGTVLNVTNAPLAGNPLINIGCPYEGCASTNDTSLIFTSVGGKFNYNFAGNYFFLNSLQSTSLLAPVITTGDGSYVNGGIHGGAPVAMTAASGVPGNAMTSLGNYGTFGSGPVMETSATMAAKTFAAGTIIGGALPPGTPGVTTDLSGSTSYSYVCTANTQNGESLPSSVGSTSQGNAVLSSSHPNTVRCVVGVGATSTNVYRAAVTGSYGIGQICSNVPNNTIDSTSAVGCQDIGQAAGAAPPTSDTTGAFQLSGSQALTSVQGTAGTKIPAASGTFTNGHPRMTNSTGDEVDGPAGFTGTCAPTTTITVSNGIITGCS